MCTLSLFSTSDGYRVFMNRDERHDRAPELSPRMIDAAHGIYGPIDPASGGTWIAHNQNGYWGTLLNGYSEKDEIQITKIGQTSRGEILRLLLAADDPFTAMKTLDVERYMSFSVLIGSNNAHALWHWNGTDYAPSNFHETYEDRAFFLTSSSWRQEEVVESRKGLFRQWCIHYTNDIHHAMNTPDFHYTQTPTLEFAPLMMRSYSGTKSITTLDVRAENIIMGYDRIHTIAAQVAL